MDHSQVSTLNSQLSSIITSLVRETQIYSRERNTKRCSSSSSVHHSSTLRTPNDENPLRIHQNPNPKTSKFSFSSTMEEDSNHQSTPMASLHNNNSSSSSTIRFLGLLKQPDPDPNPNPFELDESDVIWSSSCDDDVFDSPTVMTTTTNSSPSSLNRHPFRHEKFGLSAALSDTNQHPFIQRKRALNPSFSATSVARMIPPVVVPIPRSGSSSDGYYSSSSGKFHQSAPVNVPVWPKASSNGGGVENMGFFDEEDDGDEEMLPPHEIVARSHVTTFSVFEGVGRTLKGRDLRRVRNAIWQKTGFLD